jgi:hypothetical protein
MIDPTSIADVIALGGCAVGWCMTRRAIRQRDAAERKLRLLLARRDERTIAIMDTKATAAVPPHLRPDVTVRIPVQHDEPTRLDLGAWRLPTAQDMAAWASRAAGTRGDS